MQLAAVYTFHRHLLLLFTPKAQIHFIINDGRKQNQLECGAMPNMMVALPNIGGTLCSTPQSLAGAHY